MNKYTAVFLLFSMAFLALVLLALAPSAGAAVMEVTNNEKASDAAWIEAPASLGPVRVWNHQNPDSTNTDWWKFNASGGQHIEIKYRKYSESPRLSELGGTWTAYALWDLHGPYVPGIDIYEYTSTRPGQGQNWQDYHIRDTFSMTIPEKSGGIYFIRVYVQPSGQGWDRTGYYFLNVTVSDVPSFDTQASYDGVMGMHETYNNVDPTVCVDFNFEDVYTIDLDATATSGDLLAISLSKASGPRQVYVEIWSRIPYGNSQKDHLLNRTYFTGTALRIEATAPHTGTYYVKVYRNFYDEEDPDTAYTVTAFVDSKTLEGDDVAVEATNVPKASKVMGRTLEMGYDTHDWYGTEVKAGDRVYEVILDLTASNLADGHGVELCVYNEQGQVMWVVGNRYWGDDQYEWRDQLSLPPKGTSIPFWDRNVTWFVRVSVDPEISSGGLTGFETTYNIEFKLANRAPTLLTPFEDVYEWDEDGGISIELDSHFVDIDGDEMAYVVRDKDPAFSVDQGALSNDGYLNITSPPDWNGEDTWRLIAKDKGGGITHEITIHINIMVNAVPDRPRVNETLTAACDEETNATVDLDDLFYDVDEGVDAQLTFGWDDPGDLDVTVMLDPASGEMTMFPGPDVFGEFTIDVWCHDNVEVKTMGAVMLTVNPINDVPRIKSAIPIVEMDEGDTDPVEVNLAPYFIDVDGDDLTYRFEFDSDYKDQVTIIHKNNVLTESILVITIDNEYFYANIVVNITCTDEKKTFIQQDMMIEISPVPNPPEVLFKPSNDPSDIVEGDSLMFEIEDVHDHDQPEIGLHNITWYLDGVVVKSEVGSSSQYTYTSNYASEGTHTVKAIIVDPVGLGPAEDPKWTFYVADKNRIPTAEITTVPVALDEGDPISLTVNVSDPDNDDLTITWYHVNNNDEILGSGSSMEAKLPAGTQSIEVIVEDGKGGKATDTFVIKVNKVEEESGFGMWLGIIIVVVIVVVVALALVKMRSKPSGMSPESKMDLDSIERSYDGGSDPGYGDEYNPTPQEWEDYEELEH